MSRYSQALPTSVRTARGRPRKAPSKRRAPLAASVPRPAKRRAKRSATPSVPANIRALEVELSPEDRAYIRRKLGMKLGKLAPPIERVSVRVADVNGPRGGVDHVCRVKVVLSDAPSEIVEKRDASLAAAVDGALSGAERAVRRSVERRRQATRSRSARAPSGARSARQGR